MHECQKNFKSPPARFVPRGLTILFEDNDILVIDKSSGLLSVSTAKVKENTAFFLLNNYVRKGNQKSKKRVFIVHRLDRDTSGVLVFAKNEKVKRYLQDEWKEFSKKYFAVVHGTLSKKEGLITSYLTENESHKVYSVKDPEKGKLAKTQYKVIKESKKMSLLEIELLTGRKNQIRVHLYEKGNPVAGDRRYGERDKDIKRLALHAASLTINHPVTKERMTFESKIPAYLKSLVKGQG